MNWRKSSRSADQGACLEAASWRKSSHSERSDCVETGTGPGIVAVRDTEDREDGPVLEFPLAAWTAFAAALKTG